MEQIFAAGHSIQAHLVRSFLESEGIPAVVQGEHGSSILGGYVPTMSVSVWIRPEDLHRALDLLGEFLEGDEEAGFAKCPECSQVLDAETDRCWRCGAPR